MRTAPDVRFRHERIDDDPPSDRLFLCETTDLTGNGRPDLIVGGLGAQPIELPGVGIELDRHSVPGAVLANLGVETDLFWYENPGWERHAATEEAPLRLLGGTTARFPADDGPTLFVGQGYDRNGIFRFEPPADPREPWTKRTVRQDYQKYHDLAVGDVDDDGRPELVGVSQQAEVVFYYDVPADPARTPWPDDSRHVVDENVSLEGVYVGDVDDDGRTEIVAGTTVYHRVGPDEWEREPVVTDWDWTRVAAADLDGDGETELVFAEGDSPVLGTHPGRVSWFDPPNWEEHRLHDDLFNPHTLAVADFTDTGAPDIYVAEMGLGKNDAPVHLLYRNDGTGSFTERVIERRVPTHEARAVDLTGDGVPDVIGKSYQPNPHVDVWYTERDTR